MIKINKFKDLGKFQNDWLSANYHFSFSNYYNPNKLGIGNLIVINDDLVQAGQGFDMHRHHDMEIITYVRAGAIIHRDSLGNEGVTKSGDVQVMSAGSGIAHSEHSIDESNTKLFQIWIKPNKVGIKPRFEAKEFPRQYVKESLYLLVSGIKEDNVLFINQDNKIFGGLLKSNTQITQPISKRAYLLVAKGKIEIDGKHQAGEGDGVEISDISSITIQALQDDSEVVLIDNL